MKHGAMLTAVVFGFLMSSGAGVGQTCNQGLNWCPGKGCITGPCNSTVAHFKAEPETAYVLPNNTPPNDHTVFRCERGSTISPRPDGYFVCESTEPQKSKPEENSKK